RRQGINHHGLRSASGPHYYAARSVSILGRRQQVVHDGRWRQEVEEDRRRLHSGRSRERRMEVKDQVDSGRDRDQSKRGDGGKLGSDLKR
ncbi:hypothetical protein A2U01_0072990, partial [Trifolium medium]|nr:hypothetical protein [Trifolium medium]